MTDTTEFNARIAVATKAHPNAYRYACSLRNTSKRLYALAYLKWVVDGHEGDEPERPAALSAMGAQAVRHNFADMPTVTKC